MYRLADIENRLVVAKGEERGMDGERGVHRCKLLEWRSNEIQCRHYTQSLGLDQAGR